MQRRLAAILAADVVGYSRLMGKDEAGTLQRLTALREGVLEPLIAEHTGRIVKLMGDGLLVEFASIVDAVGCAVAWQTAVDGHEAEQHEDDRLTFRIGVNLGDVIVEGDDIHGDGVNIAARLEGLAEPGGICLSGDAYRQVRGKIEVDFEDLGEREVKNVAEPLRVYRIATARRSPIATSLAVKPLPLPNKPSIAVLPFTNMPGDPEQDYFSDGITEDIITELSRFRSLFVIARNSSFTYKGQAINVTEVGQALGVQYVVEGSVRKAGNQVRVTAQLVQAATGNHLWAERYDRKLEDIFAVQDEITRTVVAILPVRLEADRLRVARRKPTESMDAYDFCLRGKELTDQWRASDLSEEIAMYERSVGLDPGFARAHAFLSFALLKRWFEPAGEPSDLRAASMASRRAVNLDAEDGVCHREHARTSLFERKHDQAMRHVELALALNPNDADTHGVMALVLNYMGRPEEAIERLRRAMRLNPLHPTWYWEALGQAHLLAGRYEDAVSAFRMIQDPASYVHSYLAGCLTALGRTDEAELERVKLLESDPAFRIDRTLDTEAWQSEADLEHLRGLYKAAGLPE